MKKFVVGLTGGIGSGKTTVSDLFAAKGIDIIDADVVAREVVQAGTKGLKQLIDVFGKEILLDNGQLNRAKLRELVFTNTKLKDTLNSILHPLIREEMLNQLDKSKSHYCILSAPLLFENNLQSMVSTNLVVDISEQDQIKRTIARDASNEDIIRNIIKAQVSREKRLSLAEHVIDNSGDLKSLQKQVDKLHLLFTKEANKKQ